MYHVAEQENAHGLFAQFPSFHCSAFQSGKGTRKQTCFSRYTHLLNTLSSGKALCFLLFVSICLVSITYDSTHSPLWGGWHTIRHHKSHSAIRVCLPAAGQDALDVISPTHRLCVYTSGHTGSLSCTYLAWSGKNEVNWLRKVRASHLFSSLSFCKYEWNKRALHQLLMPRGPVSPPPHYFCPVFLLPFQILFYYFEEKQQTGERVSRGLGIQGRSSSARLPGICRAAIHLHTHSSELGFWCWLALT